MIFFYQKSGRPVIFNAQKKSPPAAVLTSPVSDKFCSLPNALDFCYNHYPRQSLDVNYGIRVENGDLLIGDQPVKVEDNKIIINGKEYVSTPNLWALIMQKKSRFG